MAKGLLRCKKFGKEMSYEEAECPRPADYFDNREKCAIWFLTEERQRLTKRKGKEVTADALV